MNKDHTNITQKSIDDSELQRLRVENEALHGTIKSQHQTDMAILKRLKKFETRLEIDPEHEYDAIDTRDETIRMLGADKKQRDEVIKELREALKWTRAGKDTGIAPNPKLAQCILDAAEKYLEQAPLIDELLAAYDDVDTDRPDFARKATTFSCLAANIATALIALRGK